MEAILLSQTVVLLTMLFYRSQAQTNSSNITNDKPEVSGSLRRDKINMYGFIKFVKYENSFLNVSAALSAFVLRQGECALLCANFWNGLSFNYAVDQDEHGRHVCEILATDKYNDSTKFLTNRTGFSHYGIQSPCSSSPCLNGATCDALYEKDEHVCKCKSGFQGTFCEKEIIECASNPCLNQGICTDLFNGFKCACLPGFSGVRCENSTVAESGLGPLNQSAAANQSVNHICSRNEKSTFSYMQSYLVSHGYYYYAICGFGWFKYRCLQSRLTYTKAYRQAFKEVYKIVYFCCPGWEKPKDGGSECSINIDECASNPCKNGASCNDFINGYNCTCAKGYEGANCEIDIDECASNPCKNGKICKDLVNGYNCTCPGGYEGSQCDIEIDECASNPCKNGASCTDLVNGYNCTCVAGYEGSNCEVDINECASNPCQNGAVCNDLVNGYNCSCAGGYGGLNCELDINECENKPCQNGGTCIDKVNSYNCTCAVGYTGNNCENIA